MMVVLATIGGIAGRASAPVAAQDTGGVTTITGTLSLDLAADPLAYVGLIDLTGFFRRDYNYVQGD